MKPIVVLTGGGTAGHVMVHLALLPLMRSQNWVVHYIGSVAGMERALIQKETDVTYHPIATGKFRRYMTWRHVQEPFLVAQGVVQAIRILKKLRPMCVFAKGGFVSVPVALAAAMLRIPVVLHESDWSPGLANRLCAPFAHRICTTFAHTVMPVAKNRIVHIGPIVRPTLLHGCRRRGLAQLQLTGRKPVLLVVGGSLGAQALNTLMWRIVPEVCARFDVVHVCGKGRIDATKARSGYVQLEYVDEAWPDVLACADLVVSRAGANAIHEFLRLRKPMVLVPLPAEVSRGDQLDNAAQFEREGVAYVLPEERCITDPSQMTRAIESVFANREKWIAQMNVIDGMNERDGLSRLMNLLIDVCAWRQRGLDDR